MAECPFCHKYTPDGVMQCPHCHAALQTPTSETGGTISPFELRARAALARRQPVARSRLGLRMPASRLAVFGCLGLVALLIVVGGGLAIFAPDTMRTLLAGEPTPLPPTPRPTPTSTPMPTATPEWVEHEGTEDGFVVSFPPHWVVINFASWNWQRMVQFESLRYSWLVRELPEGKRQLEAEASTIWAFDPTQFGHFSIRCRVAPEHAGMTATEMQENLGGTLIKIPASRGGRTPGGVRVELVEIDGRPAAEFEMVMLPGENSTVDQPIQFRYYALADEVQGYWIEIEGIQEELARDALVVKAVLDSFHITAQGAKRDD